MRNKTFYDIVSKTKLIKIFEDNKVMYETYFGVQGPGPGPEPVPEFEDFKTAEYYADRTTRLNDLITNIDVEGIRPPAFINYSYSNYPLPEGQNPYVNGRFEQANHPIEDKGFSVEFKLKEFTKVTVNVGSPSGSVNADVAVMNNNNEFVSAVSYHSAVSIIDQGLYSVPSSRSYDYNVEINYELEPGTYRIGTPCQTSTQGLRIYGIYKTVEPEPQEIYMSISGHPYSAEVGSLVKSLLQVTVVYDDGSSKELEDTDYQTNNALIYEGPNEIIVTYKDFTAECTIIGLQPVSFEPIEWYTTSDFNLGQSTLPDPGCNIDGVITVGAEGYKSTAKAGVNATFENLAGEVIHTDYGLKMSSTGRMYINITDEMPGATLLIIRGNNNTFADLKLSTSLGDLTKISESKQDNLTYQYYTIPEELSVGEQIEIVRGIVTSELSAITYVKIYKE